MKKTLMRSAVCLLLVAGAVLTADAANKSRLGTANAGRVDTGQLAYARDRISIERRPAIDRGERPEVERDSGCDDVRGIEADRAHQARVAPRSARLGDHVDVKRAERYAQAHGQVALDGARLSSLLGHVGELVRQDALAFPACRRVPPGTEEDILAYGQRIGAHTARERRRRGIVVQAHRARVDAIALLGLRAP